MVSDLFVLRKCLQCCVKPQNAFWSPPANAVQSPTMLFLKFANVIMSLENSLFFYLGNWMCSINSWCYCFIRNISFPKSTSNLWLASIFDSCPEVQVVLSLFNSLVRPWHFWKKCLAAHCFCLIFCSTNPIVV